MYLFELSSAHFTCFSVIRAMDLIIRSNKIKAGVSKKKIRLIATAVTSTILSLS